MQTVVELVLWMKHLDCASWRTNIQSVYVGGGWATSFPIYTPVLVGLSRDWMDVTQHTAHLLLSGLSVSVHNSKDSQTVFFFYSAFYLWNRGNTGQGWWRLEERGVGMEIITSNILPASSRPWHKSHVHNRTCARIDMPADWLIYHFGVLISVKDQLTDLLSFLSVKIGPLYNTVVYDEVLSQLSFTPSRRSGFQSSLFVGRITGKLVAQWKSVAWAKKEPIKYWSGAKSPGAYTNYFSFLLTLQDRIFGLAMPCICKYNRC